MVLLRYRDTKEGDSDGYRGSQRNDMLNDMTVYMLRVTRH